ncbi:MAG TPA: LysR family transcriptional regulator [Pseudomonadales bacterium]
MDPRISLEQWRALVAVVEAGSYARAAEVLHKSQSAVTYAVQKIEAQLGVKAFELEGRKAVLTDTGAMLYRRARALIGEAADLERAARRSSAGWEPEIWIAVEVLFPTWLLLDCLARFGALSPDTRIEVLESVVAGAADALLSGQADLAITPQVPPGFLGEPLMRMSLVAVASPDHPLHALGRPLTERDLRAHRHLVVRDTGSARDRRTGTVDVNQRWTVTGMATSIEAAVAGYGFAWLPEERIRPQLERGELRELPLREGVRRYAELYLATADPDFVGPGVRALAEILREGVASACRAAVPAAAP